MQPWSGRAAATVVLDDRQPRGRAWPSFGDTIRTEAETADHGLRIIGDLTRQLVKVPHRRKVMVFIGSASLFSPNEPSAFEDRGADFSPNWLDAIREAGRNNVSIYVIDPQSAPGHANDDAGSFTGETGGYTSTNTTNFNAVVERIWRESGSYYLLGYRAPINDHRLHKIELN